MENKLLIDKAKDFAIDIIELCENANDRKCKDVLINQIIRSATSIGANISEAKYAHSRADFISKMEIALKETYETSYWLDILFRSKCISESDYKVQNNACGTIRRILIASCKTAKENK